MKIRIRGNSVRLRLTKPDVDAFAEGGYVEEATEFAGSTFRYALKSQEGIDNLASDFVNNTITVYMPAAIKQEWAGTDIVGYNHTIETGEGRTLFLLVEKDWACIDNTLEDQSENFPNPNTAC